MADRLVSLDTDKDPGSQLPGVVSDEIATVAVNAVSDTVDGAIAAQNIPSQVAEAVAAAPAVIDAAAEAVTADIAGRDLIEGSDARIPAILTDPYPDYLLVERTSDGRMSRYVGPDGKTWVNLDPRSEIPGAAKIVQVYGTKYAITCDGRLAFAVNDWGELEVPRFSDLTLKRIVDTVGLTAGPDITCFGDSLTEGAGGGGTSYPGTLANLSHATVHNRGVIRETTVTITCRSGAIPLMVTFPSDTIPASGSAVVTVVPINGEDPDPLADGGATTWNSVTVGGVAGSITRSGDTLSFNRTAAGAAVTVIGPQPVISVDALARRGDITCIWMGQNGPSNDRALSDTAAIIQELTSAQKRFIVMNRIYGGDDAEDAQWFSIYGRRYISPRKFLNQHGLQYAGLTATSQDTTDIANGLVPISLRSDTVHLNAAGYAALGTRVHQRLVEFGWV